MLKTFDQTAFNHWIIQHKVIGIQPEAVTLKSGLMSHWYVNWRTVTADAYLLQQTAQFVVRFIQSLGLKPDAILGVPEGASKLGIACQMLWAQTQTNFGVGSHVVPMLRKSPKQHGAPQDRNFIGVPHGKIILLEDVTTSGESMFATLQQLQQLNIEVMACICLSDRQALDQHGNSISHNIKTYNTPFYSMSNAKDLLPAAYRASTEIDPQTAQHISEEVGFDISQTEENQ